ncbi:MAG: family 16 glycoside hydrolase [Chthoniobacteraceae bacterium]
MKRTLALLIALSLVVSAHAQDNSRLDLLVTTLGKINAPAAQASILKGMRDSLQGQRGIAEPKGWTELYPKLKESPDANVREHAQALAVIFGGSGALDEMRKKLADAATPPDARRQALNALVAQRDAASLDALLMLVAQPGPLREPALRGLTGYDDPRVAQAAADAFSKLDSTEKRAAMQAMLARPSGAKVFTAAIEGGKIPKVELTAPVARQIQGLKDATLDAWLAKHFGAVSAPNEDKQKLIAKYREFVTTDLVLRADAQHGRALFAQTCAVCHTLFGTGGKIGPELPGSFEDLEYLLVNILDPNAIIGKDYQQTFVKTKDGQIVAGIVAEDTDRVISLKTLGGGIITVQRADVASTEVSPLSMMPEGLLTPLHEPDVRDLFLYLRQKQQVPMLVTEVNANDFFNGSDLHNWNADTGKTHAESWRAEKGEIVGIGSASAPVALTSEMVAGDFKLTTQVRIRGEKAAAELVLCGERDVSGFHGMTLSFGGPSALALVDYRAASDAIIKPGTRALGDDAWHALQIVRKGGHLTVSVDGKVEFDIEDPRHRRRVSPAFHLLGADAELRVKALKLEPL